MAGDEFCHSRKERQRQLHIWPKEEKAAPMLHVVAVASLWAKGIIVVGQPNWTVAQP
jgi:hypothetical protein